MTTVERPDRLLTVPELAEYLRVPVRTVYEWRRYGRGPRGIRVGRAVRFRWSTVEKWLAEREESAAPPGARG